MVPFFLLVTITSFIFYFFYMRVEDLGFLSKNKKTFSKKTRERGDSRQEQKAQKSILKNYLRECEEELMDEEYEDEDFSRYIK